MVMFRQSHMGVMFIQYDLILSLFLYAFVFCVFSQSFIINLQLKQAHFQHRSH